jgi:two-component system sensor histidine kinase KdpD
MKGFIPDESLAMVFLLAVLVACVIHGRNVAVPSALLAFLAYNFLAVEPRFRFSFAPLSDTLTLAVFLAVALLTGGLAGRVRDQARAMADRASTIAMLFDASRELAKSSDQAEITTILANQVSAATGAPADVFVRVGENIAWAARGPVGAHVDQATIAFADATWSSLRNTGRGDLQNPRQSGLTAHPLGALRRPTGLLVWRNHPASEGGRSTDEQTIGVFCELGAVALERVFLMEEITKTKVIAETDRLRTALLSSISHDFRTPLSGILASATGLLDHGDHIERSMARELLSDIRDQAERINRYVANLLDMIKLESGAIAVRLEETDPIDIIAAPPASTVPAVLKASSEGFSRPSRAWFRPIRYCWNRRSSMCWTTRCSTAPPIPELKYPSMRVRPMPRSSSRIRALEYRKPISSAYSTNSIASPRIGPVSREPGWGCRSAAG